MNLQMFLAEDKQPRTIKRLRWRMNSPKPQMLPGEDKQPLLWFKRTRKAAYMEEELGSRLFQILPL